MKYTYKEIKNMSYDELHDNLVELLNDYENSKNENDIYFLEQEFKKRNHLAKVV